MAADCDGEDLRKSRFAVLLRRPSFFRLARWMLAAAFARKLFLFPLSLSLSFYAALNSAKSTGGKQARVGFRNTGITPVSLRTASQRVSPFTAPRVRERCCAGTRGTGGENAGATRSERSVEDG